MADDKADVTTLRRDPEQWATADEPMTGAQKAYLRTLCRETGEAFDDTLTKAEASRRIDALRHRSGRERGPATEGRSANEVFADHLRRRSAGELEDDLRDNFDPDVLVLAASGVHHGHDGVRYLTLLLREELPEAAFRWRTALVDRDLAFLEWEATTPGGTTEEGVDTYVIRAGRIVGWTMHVGRWR